jgi:MoaA/NifB/PqqE/SkfB family radical SAM enzyme
MCNIWRNPSRNDELSLNDWCTFLSSDLLSNIIELDITGGEPFIKKDLPAFLAAIADLKRSHLQAFRSVAITTNGFLTQRILSWVAEALPLWQKTGLEMVMVCAMDAVGDLHETIRNYKNAWAKVHETIQGLRSLQKRYSNLWIGLKTTILPLNVGELNQIARYADTNGLFAIISPAIITGGRYLNLDRADNLAFNEKDKAAMLQFFQQRSSQWSFHEERLIGYLQSGRMKKPCTCGFNYLFVRSNGELYLCPLVQQPVGNIKTASPEALFASKAASRIRRRIGAFPMCRRCTEPGLERYALPYEGWTYLGQLFKMGRQPFLQMHAHMGIDKYFKGKYHR